MSLTFLVLPLGDQTAAVEALVADVVAGVVGDHSQQLVVPAGRVLARGRVVLHLQAARGRSDRPLVLLDKSKRHDENKQLHDWFPEKQILSIM